ncbi:hypothetical protein BCR34DRAFT_437902, partial [Clohesyomyces aquaticus]
QVLCQICGVSFNIGRIRTPAEPRSAAWGPLGPMLHESVWATLPLPLEPTDQQGSYLGYVDSEENIVEHIAGPGCENKRGYPGHDISVEEMRGCQTLQCLVRKPKEHSEYRFDPLPDDEEFEKSGEFFLSGLGDHMPSRDMSSPLVTPARHGCKEPNADNTIWQRGREHDYAMPFHPSCFEVFKRVSLLSIGKVDIGGLTGWWLLEATSYEFENFPRNPDVDECAQQEWEHHKGTAYLVANSLYVPKLRDIFAHVVEVGPDFNPRDGAFNPLTTMDPDGSVDPFQLLPAEIRVEILDHLPSKDIASLRLSSRAFNQMPVRYFQKLILREMPWLWEAWPSVTNPNRTPYSIWASLTESNALDEALPAEIQALKDAHDLEISRNEDLTPFYLPPGKTNYFLLYTLITRHWKELRGLQNRKRIWTDCEEILRRIRR